MIAKFRFRSIPAIALLAISIPVVSSPCAALTARDVTEKMTKDERSGYLSGLIDMRATMAGLSGDANLPRCIHDAFYSKTGGNADGWAKLYDAFAQFPAKDAPTIVYLIVKKTCGS